MRSVQDVADDAIRLEIRAFLDHAPDNQRALFERIHAPLGGLDKLKPDALRSAYELCRRTAIAALKGKE